MLERAKPLTRPLRRAWRKLFPHPLDRHVKPLELDGLRCTCHHNWPTDPALRTAWEHLLAATPTATTFHSPTWTHAMAKTLARPRRLRLLTVTRGPELLGLLPLHLRTDGTLETLGEPYSDYLDPLIHPEHQRPVWSLLLTFLSRLRFPPYRDTVLHNIRDTSPCRPLLAELAPAHGFTLDAKVTAQCPAIPLPKTWDDYLATLDAHERKESRRKINKAYTKADAKIVRCSPDPAQIAQTLPAALSMMEQAPGEKSDDIKKYVRPLLERVAPTLITEGKLYLDTLYVHGAPAACSLFFPHPTEPQLYNCGFDPAKREYSPGVVLTAEIMRQAIDRGATTFDLLRGQEPYKYKLGATDRPLWTLTLRKT